MWPMGRPDVRYDVPDGARMVPCKGCGARIAWILTPTGNKMPVDADGSPHWASCPKASDFKRRKARPS